MGKVSGGCVNCDGTAKELCEHCKGLHLAGGVLYCPYVRKEKDKDPHFDYRKDIFNHHKP